MKINYLTLIFVAVLLLQSCTKELREPVLDTNQAAPGQIASPLNGATFVFAEDNMNETFRVNWTPIEFGDLDNNLASSQYELIMSVSQADTIDPRSLISTTGLSFESTNEEMNDILLDGFRLPKNEARDIEFMIRTFKESTSSALEYMYEPVVVSMTPFKSESDTIVEVKPIYLLGSGSSVGWVNTDALEMANIGEARYARVDYLTPGAEQYIKFISILGQWAPQWGTDEAGTPESGNLVYRPTEDVADPAAIPVGDVEGSYLIIADTIALTYETYLTSGELYLVGDATPAGWDNANGIAFTETEPHIWTISTTLNAEGGMKFLEVPGAWAPQWGTDESGTATEGMLVYRPTESVPDPVNIPTPGEGSYTITVDMTAMKYTIVAN